jgi:ribonuclease P protein component
VSDQRFRPCHRIRRSWEYRRVGRSRAQAGDRLVRAIVQPRNRARRGVARVGVVVSLKVSKKAVVRHRLKRWVREFFRTRAKDLLHGHDLVVHIRPAAATCEHQEFESSLRHCCLQALERCRGARPSDDER